MNETDIYSELGVLTKDKNRWKENIPYTWQSDRNIVAIDCTAVENVEADNLYQRSELDYLIWNDPTAYAELILNGEPQEYLKTVTVYFSGQRT